MRSILIIFAVFSLNMACSDRQQASKTKAEGDYGLENMSNVTKKAIVDACDIDYAGIAASPQECYLLMAGVTVREASWKENKTCEAWGNASDPACGLTQSRRKDCEGVGLTGCKNNPSDPVLNVRTGLRNIGCEGEVEYICQDRYGNLSIDAGVRKHLGGNTRAYGSYKQTMRDIYNRNDVREHFNVETVRSFDEVYNAQTSGAGLSVQKPNAKAPATSSEIRVGGYSCEQQKSWGKCDQPWMKPCAEVCDM